MHSRIFQVSKNPIDKGNYITESDYYDHWFLGEIADYVNDDCDRGASIEWLASCSKGYVVDKDNAGLHSLVVCNKEEYFKAKYDMFISELQKIGTPTIEQFATGIDLWRFKDAYDDKFGFYVDVYYDEHLHDLMTLDEFMRHSNDLDRWYIGGVIDYHF